MTVLFLTFRVLHVLLAAVWIGSTVFIAFQLMPAMKQAGPAGGQIMAVLNRRSLPAYMASLGGITVLTGIYLFWRFTGGFSPEISGSPSGIVYSIGGLAGVLALIIGGAVVGRSAKQAGAIIDRVGSLPDGAEKRTAMQTVEKLTARMASAGLVVIVLQVIALAMMAIGHYV